MAHSCAYCSKCFSSGSSLRQHEISTNHSYFCGICNKLFNSGDAVLRHKISKDHFTYEEIIERSYREKYNLIEFHHKCTLNELNAEILALKSKLQTFESSWDTMRAFIFESHDIFNNVAKWDVIFNEGLLTYQFMQSTKSLITNAESPVSLNIEDFRTKMVFWILEACIDKSLRRSAGRNVGHWIIILVKEYLM